MAITLGQLKELIIRLESKGAVDSTKMYMSDCDTELYPVEITADIVTPEDLEDKTVKMYEVTENIIVLEIPGT